MTNRRSCFAPALALAMLCFSQPARGQSPGELGPTDPAGLGWLEEDPPPDGRCAQCGRWHEGADCPPDGSFLELPTGDSPHHRGHGKPLLGTSWLNRPYSAGLFVGMMLGDELIEDRVKQNDAVFGGFRFGWDCDLHWGLETRLGWASPNLSDEQDLPNPATSEIFFGDVSFLYYPWGDSLWRPYFLAGLGVAWFDFTDDADVRHNDYLLAVPLGGGIKYQHSPWLAFRAEVVDNIAFADADLDTTINLTATFGVEFRAGGPRRSYYPWNPGLHLW